MAPPQGPPDAGWHDWLKLLVPAVFLAAIVLFWNLLRAFLSRAIFYILEHPDARRHFRSYVSETMPEIGVTIRTTASALRTLQQTVERDMDRREQQHEQNTERLDRFNTKQDEMDAELKQQTVMLGRLEGREDIRSGQNRRRGEH